VSLRLRLTLTYSALVALIIVVFSTVLFISMRQTLGEELDHRLEVRATQVRLVIRPNTTSLTDEDLVTAQLSFAPLALLDTPTVYVQVLGGRGQVLRTSESLRGESMPVDVATAGAALRGQAQFSDVAIEGGQTIRVLSVPVRMDGQVIGALQVGQSLDPLQEAMSDLSTRLQLFGIAGILASGLIGWLVAHRGVRDLIAMSRKAAEITEHRDFGRRLELERSDEIGRLAHTIDGLLSTVDATLRTHREFVSETSHELRNPLLAIRTNLDLLDYVSDPAARAECVTEARQQVERMTRLVQDLLMLAQVDSRQLIDLQPVQLAPLVEQVARRAQLRAVGQEIKVEHVEPIELLGDGGRIEQVLSNLVDNALKHTPPGGTIALQLDRTDQWARLAVIDTGEGIPAEHLPHIFERFYRAVNGTSRVDGSGLGLAIVKHLAEAHGGRVTAESRPGAGSRFTVWLPLPNA
jgi:signal transduction histidine kinase